MYEIEILPIKKLLLIAADACLENTAVLAVSSYPIDTAPLGDCTALSLHSFHDVVSGSGAFNDMQAREIKDFVLSLPRELDTLFVCCDCGESRSPAMAAAILRYLGRDEMRIWAEPRYHPNTLVYSRLCSAFGFCSSPEELRSLRLINEAALKKAIRG